jgi:hypothetical protein
MVFYATFNNISVISWWSVLLVKENGGPGENHRTFASHLQTVSHNVVHLALIEIWTHNISGKFLTCVWSIVCICLTIQYAKVKVSVVISIDCIESCKSIYHTISVTTVPLTISIVYKSIHVNKNYRMHDGI